MSKRAFLAALTVALISCSRWSEPQAGGTIESSDSQFQVFVDDYFARYFQFYPSAGTAAGLHEYDTQLENYSINRVRNRISQLRQQAAHLESIRKLGLSEQNAMDALILDHQIKSELLEHEVIRSYRKNPMMYAAVPGNSVDSLMKRSFAPMPERLRSMTARMKGIPPLLDALRNNVTEPPKEFAELALRLLKGSVGFFRDTAPVWAHEAAGTSVALREEFDNENRKVVAALEVAAHYMETEVLPVATGRYAIGADTFSKKLLFEEMVDIPLKTLLEIGEANLQRDYKAFVETAKKIQPGASPADVMRSIANDHPREENLLGFAEATAENIRKFVVDRKIIPIPSEVRATIQYTPPYARSGGFASMDTPGPYEAQAAEAFYYVTPPEKDWSRSAKEEHLRLFNRSVMDVITVHEAYPGHYVQFLYAKQFPTKVRKLVACGSNAEGWAHYAEQMMLEEGFGGGDLKIKLAQLAEALVRDARYVAGIKLHTQDMPVEQATRIFIEKAFLEPTTAYEEARRGAYNPTYLYYTLGKLQIYKLREDYRRAKGPAYSLAQFHSDFIKQGAIPIRLVRQILLPGDKGPTL